MNCSICGKLVVLSPSAADRAKNCGEAALFFIRLFTAHTQCQLDKRNRETLELMRRTREQIETIPRG